jgi:hypothetical protein
MESNPALSIDCVVISGEAVYRSFVARRTQQALRNVTMMLLMQGWALNEIKEGMDDESQD